ncbi:MAG: hypothetical protein WCM76_13280 [Bacteroidota bacterium]
MKRTITLMFIALFALTSMQGNAQEKKKWLSIGSDLMSRYVWRGTCYSRSPNVQPSITFDPGIGLKAGAWGSYGIMGDYAEADLFLSYSFKGVSLTLNDYYFPNESAPVMNYFNYKSATTGHQFEAALGYDGPEKFPIHFLAGTIVYGADKKLDKTTIDTVTMDTTMTYKSRFSTYFELGYTFGMFNVFAGFTPAAGIYGDGMGVINAGITARKEIKITDKFSLPAQMSVITNPRARNIYFVFGISI